MTTQAQAIRIAREALSYVRDRADLGPTPMRIVGEALAAIDAAAVQEAQHASGAADEDAAWRTEQHLYYHGNGIGATKMQHCFRRGYRAALSSGQPPAPLPQGDLNTAGNRHPECRYAGYKGQPLRDRATADQKLAWEEGAKAAAASDMPSRPSPAQSVALSPAPSEQDKVDAQRYRWLRDKSVGQWIHPIVVEQQRIGERMAYIGPLSWEALDVAIDAARASQGEENG